MSDADRDVPDPEIDEPAFASNPLAIVSMLFATGGILGFFTCLYDYNWAIVQCFISGTVAVACGYAASQQDKRQNEKQSKLIDYGMNAGIVVLVFTIAALIYLPLQRNDRTAHYRSSHVNNFKQVGLALHNHADVWNDHLPSPIYDPYGINFPNGTGLSWRVGLLPFMEQETLYNKFDETQTWDSPDNFPHSNIRVKNYEHVRDPIPSNTRMQVFVGSNTLFDPTQKSQRLTAADAIPDGMSNTILLAESAKPVPWASPWDMAYIPNGPLPAFGHPAEKSTLILYADGSVRAIKRTAKPAVWHALIQRNDGVTLPAGWDE